ncbi:MAG: hypothetical protein CVV64_01130 [Candidatus Wallbacteria bacterium HGW-Wallbacteria-1]|jgi:HEAT repeat protein|uniref:HEAT repeat domain-containing protein n=1 Tax=Candidatus Wallbacteria bacterium HGW-Wallbacteria-1 TaxID=2013854 RepID=A0A2N1PUQ9_9BACT|nr:MAG: hypothetical protein CVV64_01130 [Candidatus Wallbacteria bacterium HGW-Wallbacteria-1]
MYEIEIEAIIRDMEDLDPSSTERGHRNLRRLPREAATAIVKYLQRDNLSLKAKGTLLELEYLQEEPGAHSAAAQLLEKATDPYFSARCIAFLGKTGKGEYAPLIEIFLTHSDDRVVANSIETLGLLGDANHIELLLPFLHGRTERIKANAIIALHRLGSSQVRDHLKNLKGSEMTRSIQYALGAVGLEILSENLNMNQGETPQSDVLIALGLHLSNTL